MPSSAEDLDLEPGDGAARVALAEAYMKQQNTAAARTELERALVLDPAVGWKPGDCCPAFRQMSRRTKTRASIADGGRHAVRRRPPARGRAAPVVYTAEVDGIIQPVIAEYLRATIEKADAAGAALVVITLRTPGGLLDTTRDINSAIIGAKTPVAVFVGPSGKRAASAGFLITMAADIAAMAPGHSHRRCASRVGRRRKDRRDDGEEDGVRYRQLRPHARRSSASATPC